MRIFGGDRIKPWMERLGLQDGEAIEHRMVSRSIENAQKKVEARNFDIRKHLLDYDNVMNQQRKGFYGKRREVLGSGDVHEEVLEIVEGVLVTHLGAGLARERRARRRGARRPRHHARAPVRRALRPARPPFRVEGRLAEREDGRPRAASSACSPCSRRSASAATRSPSSTASSAIHRFADYEREILLRVSTASGRTTCTRWTACARASSLRGYAQKDPKLEYQREGFALFEQMGQRVDHEVAELVFKFVLPDPGPAPASAAAARARRRRRRARSRARGPACRRRAAPRRALLARPTGTPGAAALRSRRPQRPVPVRERQEVQEVPRRRRVAAAAT